MPNEAADVQSKLSFISLSDCVSFSFINHSNKTWRMRLNVPTWKKIMMTREWLVELWWFWHHLFDGNMLWGSTWGHFLFLTSYIISRLVRYQRCQVNHRCSSSNDFLGDLTWYMQSSFSSSFSMWMFQLSKHVLQWVGL